MREILFRGKRVDNGEWVYGNFIEDKWGDDNGNTVYAILQDRVAPEIAALWTPVKVIPETIGQFTGLTDKNGKRIFEGDIVELEDCYYDTKWRAVVEFGNPNGNYTWGWQLNPIGKVDINTDILCWVEMEEAGAYCEVIGNIHDNPELLEVEE